MIEAALEDAAQAEAEQDLAAEHQHPALVERHLDLGAQRRS